MCQNTTILRPKINVKKSSNKEIFIEWWKRCLGSNFHFLASRKLPSMSERSFQCIQIMSVFLILVMSIQTTKHSTVYILLETNLISERSFQCIQIMGSNGNKSSSPVKENNEKNQLKIYSES